MVEEHNQKKYYKKKIYKKKPYKAKGDKTENILYEKNKTFGKNFANIY